MLASVLLIMGAVVESASTAFMSQILMCLFFTTSVLAGGNWRYTSTRSVSAISLSLQRRPENEKSPVGGPEHQTQNHPPGFSWNAPALTYYTLLIGGDQVRGSHRDLWSHADLVHLSITELDHDRE